MMARAPTPAANRFAFGAKEVENMMGAFFFFDTTQNQRPSIDFALDSLRLGIMLNDPWAIGPLSGNFEVLGEVFAGGIFTGPGDVLAGATLVFRYNFVQPQARLVPYMQIGAGGVYTNIPEDESRGLISLPVEFNLQAGVGTRFLVNDHWSINVEGVYRHISNAEIKKPNYGIDAVGGNLGFGFSF
jgi:lipid A 3-O-deacylase